MRVAELSRRSGVPVPTIKFYLREGLLPPGELTRPNQAAYGEHHVHRLRLIRALIDLAQVPIAQVRTVLAALDSGDPLHHRIGVAHRAVTPKRRSMAAGEADRAAAADQVRGLIERRGWRVGPSAPALGTLIDTVAALRGLGQDGKLDRLDAYADIVERLAELEVGRLADIGDADRLAESVVIGTVLGETLIAALRLLAHESISAATWPTPSRAAGPPPS
ncbi:MAG TPA: MerR family transcriptional regulator [Micromonosporaceae bacterium]|nr:MerR family transcriptional regulator [Micromonosporaceae bacterium]